MGHALHMEGVSVGAASTGAHHLADALPRLDHLRANEAGAGLLWQLERADWAAGSLSVLVAPTGTLSASNAPARAAASGLMQASQAG